mgnify:CR=1 FL=1
MAGRAASGVLAALGGPIGVAKNTSKFVVIESGALEFAVFPGKS